MDKLKMAHEVACAMINNGCSIHTATADAWRYADAMQAEADKRAVEPDVGISDVSEWQPDWSQAPTWAKYWQMKSSGDFHWLEEDPFSDMCDWLSSRDYMTAIAPTFGYTGAWQDSLRKRPNT
jgi:hypothetical protein